jgi:hypothetical protein
MQKYKYTLLSFIFLSVAIILLYLLFFGDRAITGSLSNSLLVAGIALVLDILSMVIAYKAIKLKQFAQINACFAAIALLSLISIIFSLAMAFSWRNISG